MQGLRRWQAAGTRRQKPNRAWSSAYSRLQSREGRFQLVLGGVKRCLDVGAALNVKERSRHDVVKDDEPDRARPAYDSVLELIGHHIPGVRHFFLTSVVDGRVPGALHVFVIRGRDQRDMRAKRNVLGAVTQGHEEGELASQVLVGGVGRDT